MLVGRQDKHRVALPHLPRPQDPHLVQEHPPAEELHRPPHPGSFHQPEDGQLQDEAGATGESYRAGEESGGPGDQGAAEAGWRLQ